MRFRLRLALVRDDLLGPEACVRDIRRVFSCGNNYNYARCEEREKGKEDTGEEHLD